MERTSLDQLEPHLHDLGAQRRWVTMAEAEEQYPPVTVDEAKMILGGKSGVWREWEHKARWALQTLIKADLTERFGRNFFMPQLETYPWPTYYQP